MCCTGLAKRGTLVLSWWAQFSPHTFIEGPVNVNHCARHVKYNGFDHGPLGLDGRVGWIEIFFQLNVG